MTGYGSSEAGEYQREASRRRDGRFGVQHRAEASLDLGGYREPPETSARRGRGESMISTIRHRDHNVISKEMTSARAVGDVEAMGAAEARDNVNSQVDILLRTTHKADSNNASPFFKALMRQHYTGKQHNADAGARRTGPLDVARATEIRDFCFAQAARYGSEARVSGVLLEEHEEWPLPEEPEWSHERDRLLRDRGYSNALADSYAYWACAVDAGGEPDPEPLGALQEAIREPMFDHGIARHWSSDPAPDRTEEWASAVGAPSQIESFYAPTQEQTP